MRRHDFADSRSLNLNTAKQVVAKIAHMAMTPHIENGVGDANNSASITSGGLVIHRPTICTTTLNSNAIPSHRCISLEIISFNPGRKPAASKGWHSKIAKATTPAKPATM